MGRSRAEAGVALITALLVVALASAAAVALASRQRLELRRTTNLIEADRAYQLALGAEAWARGVLLADRGEGQIDHPGEPWALPLAPQAVAEGEIAASIEDLQGRFNLNAIWVNGAPEPVALERFRRLLRLLELPPGAADALLDWLDPDLTPRYPDGAEDAEYLAAATPYRAANRPLADLDELRLVKGFDDEALAKLAPYVCVLPEATPINVNTALPLVLMSLGEGITAADADSLVEARGESGYEDLERFLQHPGLAGIQLSGQQLALSSRYFRVMGRATSGRMGLSLESGLLRDTEGPVQVYYRRQRELIR